MKTLNSLIHDSEARMELWLDVSNDAQALEDRDKTKHEAEILASYFEGKRDAYIDIKRSNLI